MNANIYNMKSYIFCTYLNNWWKMLDVYLTMYNEANTCYFLLFEFQNLSVVIIFSPFW